ncbi:hypothetical protein MOO45_06820 [Bombilactobacillus folatiphilus]|uniref:WxL domain-containing protein n=1 Tax=Bombilactobacillus folatiphilus TaxID=2923362 RepID=A0ABY4P8E9_9LACO|nr:hypothetical protein [Bombilactobacillus folatiphilus]UQS81899.1 hypothetical protein MOO45_06820 [Bombilactobacillus folatiphilus]
MTNQTGLDQAGASSATQLLHSTTPGNQTIYYSKVELVLPNGILGTKAGKYGATMTYNMINSVD